jgi:SAM-dependent methyltransferase
MTVARERVFWDDHVPDLADCLGDYERGPSPNTSAMLDKISPLRGKRVLDFACGAGVLSAWMAARGAEVLGVDISTRSIVRARELATHLGLRASFTTDDLAQLPTCSFDAAVGQYALHHVDLTTIAPRMRRVMKPDAVGAFVETMALNPVLNLARQYFSGRGLVARYGSDDEQPLGPVQLATLKTEFGDLALETREMAFMRILDRNLFRYRSRPISHAAGRIDDWLLSRGLGHLSYHQVVVLRNTA